MTTSSKVFYRYRFNSRQIGSLIAEVVRNWEPRTVSDRFDLVLGSDLQYIRMNHDSSERLWLCDLSVVV